MMKSVCAALFLLILTNFVAAVPSSNELQSFLEKGEQLLRDGKPAEAIQVFQQGLEAGRKVSRSKIVAFMHLGLARAYAITGENQKAVENAKLAIELNPEFSQAYSFLARFFLDTGQFKASLQNASHRFSCGKRKVNW
jgi:tetratricopeptide (TPR) repeat protein